MYIENKGCYCSILIVSRVLVVHIIRVTYNDVNIIHNRIANCNIQLNMHHFEYHLIMNF